MRLFLKKTLIFALLFALAAAAVCVYIDPYNVFHPLSLRENGVEPNKNYIKMTYILSEPDKFDAFVFGSSRAGFINVQKLDGLRAYNMSYSWGVPQEHLDNLKTFIKKGIIPKSVFIEIDNMSYLTDPAVHRSEQIRAPYEYLRSHPLKFAELYLDPVVALSAREIIQYSERNADIEADFYNYGVSIDYGERGKYTPRTKETLDGPEYMQEMFETLRELRTLCEENEIELCVFITPMHYATYTAALERGDYYEFLRGTAEILPFYNFSGYNDITLDADNYMDTSHYLAEIGDMIIDCIRRGETPETLLRQGFGFYTTKDNVEELIGILEAGRSLYSPAD